MGRGLAWCLLRLCEIVLISQVCSGALIIVSRGFSFWPQRQVSLSQSLITLALSSVLMSGRRWLSHPLFLSS